MPSARAAGRKPVSLWLDQDLLSLIDAACKTAGVDRSRFFRDSAVAKLNAMGYSLGPSAGAPARKREPLDVAQLMAAYRINEK